ncbi:MAG: glycosyltransferase family 4 protein [Patescibacteria group bacterium]
MEDTDQYKYKKKSKVLFILHFPPPIHGSAVVGKLISESSIINSSFKCEYINISTSRNTSEVGNKGIKKYIRTLQIYLKILLKLCNNNYDLCYLAITVTNSGLFKDAPIVCLCKLFNNKIIIHQHNKGISSFHKKRIYNRIYNYIYKNVKVMLLSEQLYNDVSNYVDYRDVYFCPNGIKNKDIPNHSLARTNKIPHLLFLSNLIESKGCIILLDACQKLKEKGILFYCDFVGGESKEISKEIFVQEIVSRNLSSNVFYHGPKYDTEKESFFCKSNIFVLPTYFDCFPLVIIEAMQYRLPIVSTFEGGIPDIVDNGTTGFLVKQKNSIELADKLEKLILEPELRKQMGEAGYLKYIEKFTLDKFEETFVKNLSNTLGEKNIK